MTGEPGRQGVESVRTTALKYDLSSLCQKVVQLSICTMFPVEFHQPLTTVNFTGN